MNLKIEPDPSSRIDPRLRTTVCRSLAMVMQACGIAEMSARRDPSSGLITAPQFFLFDSCPKYVASIGSSVCSGLAHVMSCVGALSISLSGYGQEESTALMETWETVTPRETRPAVIVEPPAFGEAYRFDAGPEEAGDA